MEDNIFLSILGVHTEQTVKQLNEWMTCDDDADIRMLRDAFKDAKYWIDQLKKKTGRRCSAD